MKNTVLDFYGFGTPRLYSLQPNGKNGITMCQTQNVGKMLRNRTPGGQSVPLRCAGGGLLQPEKPSSGTQNTAFRKSESRKNQPQLRLFTTTKRPLPWEKGRKKGTKRTCDAAHFCPKSHNEWRFNALQLHTDFQWISAQPKNICHRRHSQC